MKKIISFLVVCILLFSLFVIPSNAAMVSVPEYYVYEHETVYFDTTKVVDNSLIFDPFNDLKENYTNSSTLNYTKGATITVNNSLRLESKNGNYLIRKGGTATVVFSGVWLGYILNYGGSEHWSGVFTFITVNIWYSDGSFYTIERIEDLGWEYENKLHTFSFDFVPEKNVVGITYNTRTRMVMGSNYTIVYNPRLGEYSDPVTAYSLQVNQDNGVDGSGDEVGFWQSVLNFFDTILDTLFDLPRLIWGYVSQGIKDIFIPDTKILEAELKATVNNIGSQLGVHFDTFDRLFDTSIAPEDVVEDYYIHGLGNLKLKFVDTSYLIKGVAFFRPIIRGVLVLLLLFYNWKQALTLIDQNPAIASGAVQGLASHQQSTQMKIDL